MPNILDMEGKFLAFTGIQFKKKYTKKLTKPFRATEACATPSQSIRGKFLAVIAKVIWLLQNRSQFSHLGIYLRLAGKPARFMYPNKSFQIPVHQKLVLLTLDSQIKQLRRLKFFLFKVTNKNNSFLCFSQF